MCAVTKIHSQRHLAGSVLGSAVICVSADQLMVVEIEEMEKTVPRHLPIGGTPKKMIYSPLLNLLIVGFTKKVLRPASVDGDAPNPQSSSVAVSSLSFIDPDR